MMDSNAEAAAELDGSDSSIDFENVPVFGVGEKRSLNISTYVELHEYIQQLVRMLEEVFELGILKGSAKKYRVAQSADEGPSSDDSALDQDL